MPKKKILLVDDNVANLTACKKTLKDLYDVYPAPSAEQMFKILLHVMPDLILLDVEMPETDGYTAMRALQESDAYRDIPVIFLSAMDDASSEVEGLKLGAVDYIHKPFNSSLLIRRIETHLRVVDGRSELQALNKSIEELLAQKVSPPERQVEADEAAIKELLSKEAFLSRMGHEIRKPLAVIISKIEASVRENNIHTIKQYLAEADTEASLILEILNDIIDVRAMESDG